MSSICLGTSLYIELNGLKMTQQFGTCWLIVGIQIDTRKYFDTWLYLYFTMMLDAWYYTGGSITRRSHTCILIFIKNTPITWLATVETYVLVWNLSRYLLVLIWMTNYDIQVSYDTGSPIRDLSMDIVNQLSATSLWHIQSEIKSVSSLYMLPQTRKEKENFSYVYIYGLYWLN